MLQHEIADDYVISSGKAYPVREFCDIAFQCVGLKYQDYVIVDPIFYRPAEVDILLGDSQKAKEKLHWNYTISLKEFIEEMVENNLQLLIWKWQ